MSDPRPPLFDPGPRTDDSPRHATDFTLYCGGCRSRIVVTGEFVAAFDKPPIACPECSATDWWWDCLYSYPQDWATNPGKLTGKFARPWWGREHP